MNIRANVAKLTKMWDTYNLKDCYCLIFSPVWGFKIIWNDEDGQTHSLDDKGEVLTNYFVVLAIYETEEQAKKHFKDYVTTVAE